MFVHSCKGQTNTMQPQLSGEHMSGRHMSGHFCPGDHLSGGTFVRVDICPGRYNIVSKTCLLGAPKARDGYHVSA